MGLEAYTEQHNALLLAVQSFAQKVADYKKDFLQREVLVHRGFLQYLLGTFANALSQVRTLPIRPPSKPLSVLISAPICAPIYAFSQVRTLPSRPPSKPLSVLV